MLRQFLPQHNFELQYGFKDGEKVDAIVRLPEGLLPIDSKFPLANFREVLAATGDEARQKARRQFARDVRKHIDDIAAKYIRPAEGTFDLAFMYIPAENVHYETITLPESGGADDDLSAYQGSGT
jgi:DNA recombination protein RmuC